MFPIITQFIFSIPPRRDVSVDFKDVPHVFVADDAFELHENMLKPYKSIPTQQHLVFNYRLSRARRMIENCFGILSAKFRIFRTTINADLTLVESITQSCVCLHNWLRAKNTDYISTGLVDSEVDGKVIPGSWRDLEHVWQPLQTRNLNSTTAAKKIRDRFSQYFSNAGSVPWQLKKVLPQLQK